MCAVTINVAKISVTKYIDIIIMFSKQMFVEHH